VSLNLFSENKNISLSAQNMSSEVSWAFTWEISIEMLIDLNCKYIILWHSEVRKNLWENSELINKKAKLAIKNNIIPIICISKKEQLLEISDNILKSEIIIAYEPLSAIWTWKIDNLENISENIDFIKNKIINKKSRIIYWWSVNSENSEKLSKIKNLNWFLIWGACLEVDSLLEIVNKIKK
jgi:triosephosphate isomerase